MSSDFDVAITGSVPLINDLDDVDPTLVPIKALARACDIGIKLEFQDGGAQTFLSIDSLGGTRTNS